MQKIRVLALAVVLLAAGALGAQEWDDWDFYAVDLYTRGDQIFSITMGAVIPTVFVYRDDAYRPVTGPHNFTPPVGGTISLGYTYFMGAHFFLGGDLSFSFKYTIARNVFFSVPFGLYAGWQFLARQFEFPVSLMVGMAPQRYMDAGYFGFFMRARASAFYRFSPEWSFGLNTDWSWFPQRPTRDGQAYRAGNADGQVLGITISARYHF